jgi:[acyl-carrier-protein] S-malonyltransferase
MRQQVEAHRPDLLVAVVQALGVDPFDCLDHGTAYLQPAIYCASLAHLRGHGEPVADYYAGHSLGEITALVAAGAISDMDGLELVIRRGRLMQRASDEPPAGAMLAIALDTDTAGRIAGPLGLTVANDNSPQQAVLSGPAPAIAQAASEIKARGLRAYQLPIKGAFHSPALQGIVEEYRSALAQITIRAPRRPVLSCVTAEPFKDPRAELARSLTSGVRWREVLLALHSNGVTQFLETGPGRVLSGLARKTLTDIQAHALGELEPAHA